MTKQMVLQKTDEKVDGAQETDDKVDGAVGDT